MPPEHVTFPAGESRQPAPGPLASYAGLVAPKGIPYCSKIYPGVTYLPRFVAVKSLFWSLRPQAAPILPVMSRQYVPMTLSGRKSNSIEVESSTVSMMFGCALFCTFSGSSASSVSAAYVGLARGPSPIMTARTPEIQRRRGMAGEGGGMRGNLSRGSYWGIAWPNDGALCWAFAPEGDGVDGKLG